MDQMTDETGEIDLGKELNLGEDAPLSKSDDDKSNSPRTFDKDCPKESLLTCDVCETEGDVAKNRCLECEQNLCSSCCPVHLKMTASKKHHLIAIIEENTDIDRIMRRLYCEKHLKEEICLYCTDCSVPICLRCKLTLHETHACEDFHLSKSSTNYAITTDSGWQRGYDVCFCCNRCSNLVCLRLNATSQEGRIFFQDPTARKTCEQGSQVSFDKSSGQRDQASQVGVRMCEQGTLMDDLQFCGKHPTEQMCIYCNKCLRRICMRCKVIEHGSHACEDWDDTCSKLGTKKKSQSKFCVIL